MSLDEEDDSLLVDTDSGVQCDVVGGGWMSDEVDEASSDEPIFERR